MIIEREIADRKILKRTILVIAYFLFLFADCYLLYKGNFSDRFLCKPILMPILIIYLFTRKTRLAGTIIRDQEFSLLLLTLFISWVSDILAVTSNFWLLTLSIALYLVIYPLYLLLFIRLWQRFQPIQTLFKSNYIGGITLVSSLICVVFFFQEGLELDFQSVYVPLYFNGIVLVCLLFLAVSMFKIETLQSSVIFFLLAVIFIFVANLTYAYTIFKAINKLQQLFVIIALAHGLSQFLILTSVIRFIKVKKLEKTSERKNLMINPTLEIPETNKQFVSVGILNFRKLILFYGQLPATAKTFVLKSLILIGLYLVGDTFLFNTNYWLNNDLTFLTTNLTTKSLNSFYKSGFSIKPNFAVGVCDIYYLARQHVLLVSDGCNAFKLYIFYIGFLICLPGVWKKKVIYALIGVALIFCLNIARCYALTWLNMNMPQFTNFAHHYAFTFIVYSAIFCLFLAYLKPKEYASVVENKYLY